GIRDIPVTGVQTCALPIWVFQLIALLKGGGRTVGQLASHLETTERTIYRYFKLLEEIGFIIDQDFNGRYFVHRDEGENPDDQFTLEEVSILRQLIQSGAVGHPLQEIGRAHV